MVLMIRCILFSKIGAEGRRKNRAREERLSIAAIMEEGKLKSLTAPPISLLKHLILLSHCENRNRMLKHISIAFPRAATHLCPLYCLYQLGESCSWKEQAFQLSSPA